MCLDRISNVRIYFAAMCGFRERYFETFSDNVCSCISSYVEDIFAFVMETNVFQII